jgi:hypothetical protein
MSSRPIGLIAFEYRADMCGGSDIKVGGERSLCGPFDTHIDFATEHSEIDRLGQKGFGAVL